MLVGGKVLDILWFAMSFHACNCIQYSDASLCIQYSDASLCDK